MVKKNIKKQKEPSYLERPILEVLGEIRDAHYNKINKQFSEKINNYLNDVYATKSPPGIVLAEKKLEQILEQIPEPEKIEKTALDRLLSVQENIGKNKLIIRDLNHYTKLRDTTSYEKLKRNYRGEKLNSMKGFEGQYQRKLKKDKEELAKTGKELVKAGKKLVKTLGKRTKKKVKRRGRKPLVKSSEDYIGLIESGETYESVKENYGNNVLQLRAWQANYTRHHK